jgi:hypothetical protein
MEQPMSLTFASFRNKAKWAALATSVAHIIVVIAYRRLYFNPNAHHPNEWLGTLVDAGPVFHYSWLALAVLTLTLGMLTLPKWQSVFALSLLWFAMWLRLDSP